MAQQINLCSPILLTQKRYFSANTMAVALGLFVAFGGVLAGAWVWNLKQASDGFASTMQGQSREIETLQAAIARSKANASPAGQDLLRQLQEKKALAQDRQKLLAALREGLIAPGAGHSDRLQLLARTIPAQVWITAVNASTRQFEISGYTLEPAALNAWVARLGQSPLLQGLALSEVRVESATSAPAKPASDAAATRQVWSYRLVSTQPVPLAHTPGAKP